MTRETALNFLEAHQPLPSNAELTQSVIDEFDEVRKFFAANPDQSSVRLLLNVFGDGDGLGVYQLVEDALLQQDRAAVVAELPKALQSRHQSVRYWCAQIASSFPDQSVVAPLIALLCEGDFDTKYAALTALEQARDFVQKETIADYARSENEEELRELAEEIVEGFN
jgi:hypothetical protein